MGAQPGPSCVVFLLALCLVASVALNVLLLLDDRHGDARLEVVPCNDSGAPGKELQTAEAVQLQASSAQDVVFSSISVVSLPGSHESTARDAEHMQIDRVRRAASSASSSDSSASTHDTGHHHQHVALVGLFTILVVGTGVLQLTSFRLFCGMQVTVVNFVLGVLLSVFLEGLQLKQYMKLFGVSYDMWMSIDPHLLLFTMLPLLLTGDAMTIDTHVAARVYKQCVYMAGPGVLINGFLAASFLSWYLGWSFLLSLVTGSILCATDPVAVVALLKELGASPVLTVQIQGESLLNDGTAIVLFSVAYNMLAGKEYEIAEILEFLIRTVCMACVLGAIIGYTFYLWIRFANNSLDHNSNIVQISSTLCCAYWSFIMAEGVFSMSGVLSCVTAALTLAHNMWPHVTSEESLIHVWHTFEFLGNTIIFYLAGALVGNVMVHIEAADWLHLVVIYIVLLAIRASFVYFSLPLLGRLSADHEQVPGAEATVMVWGGLRGAVGLALAIQVYNERAVDENGEPRIDENTARRVLFFVGGVAFLTTIVNASTAPALVHWLGITNIPKAKERLLLRMNENLVHYSKNRSHPAEVSAGLQRILLETKNHIEEVAREPRDSKIPFGDVVKIVPGVRSMTSSSSTPQEFAIGKPRSSRKKHASEAFSISRTAQDNADICDLHSQARDKFNNVPTQDMADFLPDTPMIYETDPEKLFRLVRDVGVDLPMAHIVSQSFLKLVRVCYQTQIRNQELLPGSDEADTLFTSVRVAQGWQCDLNDFAYIVKEVGRISTDISRVPSSSDALAPLSQPGSCGRERLVALVLSTKFNIVMSVIIAMSGIHVAIELNRPHDDIGAIDVWYITELLFTVVFTLEFLLKFAAYGIQVFCSVWHLFDFLLVVVGIVGLAATRGESSAVGAVRLARVLRTLRLLRVCRLFQYFHLIKAKLKHKKTSPEVGMHMHKIAALTCFAKAQIKAQYDFVRFFGADKDNKIGGDEIDIPEIARCILQSQTNVYVALTLAAEEEQLLDPGFLTKVRKLRYSQRITRELEQYVMEACHNNLLGNREGEAILKPLHEHMERCKELLDETMDGIQGDISECVCEESPAGSCSSKVQNFESADMMDREPSVETPSRWAQPAVSSGDVDAMMIADTLPGAMS